jgi:hypothetical protein
MNIFIFCNFFNGKLYCANLKTPCDKKLEVEDLQRTEINYEPQIKVAERSCQSANETCSPSSTQFEYTQSTTMPETNIITTKPIQHLAKQCDTVINLEKEGVNLIKIDDNTNETSKQKLLKLFNGLNNKLSDFTKFYDYYDVLTFIDKSIALIQELECAPKINVSRNSMDCKKMVEMISFEHQNLERLYETVENLYKNQVDTIKDSHKYMIDGLTDIKKRKEDWKKQFERYSKDKMIFRMEDYQKYDCPKVFQLKELREELKKIREKICPVNEQNLQNNAENYKTTFKKKVSDIYTELIECHEKEKRSLKVLFDVYKNILEGIKDAIARLNSFNDDLTGSKSKAE